MPLANIPNTVRKKYTVNKYKYPNTAFFSIYSESPRAKWRVEGDINMRKWIQSE